MQALILNGAYARAAWAPDYPIGQKEEAYLADRKDTAKRWGTIEYAQEWVDRQAPSLSHDAGYVEWFAKSLRHGASPAAVLEWEEMWHGIDVRSVLGSVQAPTLVVATPGAGDLTPGTGAVVRER